MHMSARPFWSWSNELPEKVMDKDKIEHKLWKVPVSPSAMDNINNARYFPVDSTLKTKRSEKRKKSSVQVLQGSSPISAKDFCRFRNFSIQFATSSCSWRRAASVLRI